jgi:hypothetical protein
MQSEQHFSLKQRALATGDRTFFVFSEKLGALAPPPGSYAPVYGLQSVLHDRIKIYNNKKHLYSIRGEKELILLTAVALVHQ